MKDEEGKDPYFYFGNGPLATIAKLDGDMDRIVIFGKALP